MSKIVPNIKILVCCHKFDIMATEEPYYPIQVGASTTDIRLGIQCDNEGDNISNKNPYYCELTGLYWAWKNLKDVDIIGVCHYRRYFDFHKQCNPIFPWTYFPALDISSCDLSIPSSLIEWIKNGHAIVTRPTHLMGCLCKQSKTKSQKDDMVALESYILASQPDDIKWAWFEVMHRRRQFYCCNMCIMTKQDFNDYCSWLFDVLMAMEAKIDIVDHGTEHSRIMGYHAEYLLNVYLLAKHFKLKKYPFIHFIDDDPQSSMKIRNYLHYFKHILHIYWDAFINLENNPIKQKK